MIYTGITLERGSHKLPGDGTCLVEAAIYANEGFWREVKSADDAPACYSRVLCAYGIRLNDAMPHDERQRLLPFIAMLPGTADTPEVEQQRAEVLVWCAVRHSAPSALRVAGLHEHADRLAGAATMEEAAAWAAAAAAAAAAAGRHPGFDWQPCIDAFAEACAIGNRASIDEQRAIARIRELVRA